MIVDNTAAVYNACIGRHCLAAVAKSKETRKFS
jgi:hypothetical protein